MKSMKSMKRTLLMLLAGATVAALFILLQVLFVLREGEVAVVTTFGKPERALTEAGLYRRRPWPIQRVFRFDGRIRCLEGPLQEAMTRDGKNILLSLYAGWRIRDPQLFLERIGSVEQAEANLDGLLRSYKNAVVGRYTFANLINTNPAAVRFEELEQHILAGARAEALDRYGVDIPFVGIRKLQLPESITEKVFDRMRAERNELAERYRSEGEAEAIRIRAEAARRRDELLSRAEADAKRIRAEGDAEAAALYRVFEQDPQLAVFLRKLESMETTLKERTTVVLGTDTAPFDLLRGAEPPAEAGRKK